ncbi:proteasome accessory factor PafA2 family protein [Nostoc sp. DedQUE07]|uniref:proteasome accessory factor PafA2 family protein n=1 Tax=Nostoc sp. DedQUE07 TaxID=3075392 RepID=UPI00391B009B
MSISKVTGIETEYGILIRGVKESDHFLASRMLLQQCGVMELKAIPDSEVAASPDIFLRPLYSLMLPNGARFYIDHAHPEYCTAETIHPRNVVAADKAGEIIVERCRRLANASGTLPKGQEIVIYKNNSDYKGNSYGCHENYLLAASTYKELINPQGHLSLSILVPFLVTRNIFCGAGKVGYENDNSPANFQLTQRADFFETLFGLQTTYNRPLINTRDESHAESLDFRRLHVIVGDANMSEYSTYLKVGTTQLILMMLEDNYMTLDLTLKEPLVAVKTVSRDLTFGEELPLANGSKASAIEIQRQFLELAKQYVEEHNSTVFKKVIQVWEETLNKLTQNWQMLNQYLDWAIKRNLLERYLQTQNCNWQSINKWEPVILKTLFLKREVVGDRQADLVQVIRSQVSDRTQLEDLDLTDYWRQREVYFTLRRLDLEYHDIRQGKVEKEMGLFYQLQNCGAVKRLLNDEEIQYFVNQPPSDTRAYLRGYCISKYFDQIQQVDWSEIKFYVPEEKQSYYLKLPDLLNGNKAHVETVLEAQSSTDLLKLLDSLSKLNFTIATENKIH